MFDNDATVGLDANLGKYYIERTSNSTKDGSCSNSLVDECYVDVWNNYAEGDLKGKYTPLSEADKALVKPQAKKAVLFSALYDYGNLANFAKKVDNSVAGQMRDCAECHVGGGAMEHVPVAQGLTLNAGVREELRDSPKVKAAGSVNTYNYFIDQYDEDGAGPGVKGEVRAQNYADTGVLEMDCLMCHLEGYSWDNRKEAIRKGNFDASRVAGAGLGTADNVVAGSSGVGLDGLTSAGYGKTVTYDTTLMVANNAGNATLSALALSKIKGTPASANCSSCHFDLHKVDWKKRGDTWHKNKGYESEVHGSLGCLGCHTRTDNRTMDPNNKVTLTPDNPLWTGNATSGDASKTLGHDPSKGNAPYSSLWNANDNTVRTCAGCHIAADNKTYYRFGGAPDPTTRHAQLGLTQTLIQTKGMGKMDGVANGSHLDIIMCEGCHVRKLGHGPLDSHSLYEWGTGGAMVDGSGPDPEGRLTDHENLFVERTMENNLGIAWSGSVGGKLGPRNALVSMFWLDKDDAVVDINADGQIGGIDAVNSMHVRNAMAVAGLQALTADGTMTEADIIAQKAALRGYLAAPAGPLGAGIGDSAKLKLSLMGVFFKVTHGTTPAANAWGAGGCKDCHGVDKGFYNGPYDLKPRDLQASWINNAGTVDNSAVEGGAPNWNYVVPYTAVNVDNYSGRVLTVPICSTYYGPTPRPAAPETPAQAAVRLGTAIPVTGDACASPTGTAGTWTLYALGKIKADQQFTDFHPTVWAKGQVGRSIAITGASAGTNTIRKIDRSEGLWEAKFVTGTYDGTIKGTDGNPYTTRATWVGYLNTRGSNYGPALHNSHASLATGCATCHANGGGDYTLKSGLNGTVPWFTFTWPTPKPASGQPNCTTACHVVASAPLNSKVAKATISAQHALDTNFKVKLDGSKSTCYAVDRRTGVVSPITQGAKTYAWSYADVAPTGTVACLNLATTTDLTDTIPGCVDATWAAAGTNRVTLTVSCTEGGSGTSTVGVTGFDVGAGVNALPGLVATASVNVVTLNATTLDSEVATVTINWGDNSLNQTIATADVAAFRTSGVTHTYTKTGTYKVTMYTVNDGTPNNKRYEYTVNVTVATVPAP